MRRCEKKSLLLIISIVMASGISANDSIKFSAGPSVSYGFHLPAFTLAPDRHFEYSIAGELKNSFESPVSLKKMLNRLAIAIELRYSKYGTPTGNGGTGYLTNCASCYKPEKQESVVESISVPLSLCFYYFESSKAGLYIAWEAISLSYSRSRQVYTFPEPLPSQQDAPVLNQPDNWGFGLTATSRIGTGIKYQVKKWNVIFGVAWESYGDFKYHIITPVFSIRKNIS